MIRKAIALWMGILFPFFLQAQDQIQQLPQITWGIDAMRPLLYGAWMLSGQDPGMGVQVYRFRPSAVKPKVTYRSTLGIRFMSGNLVPARWGVVTVPFPEKENGSSHQYLELRFAPGKSWTLLTEKKFQLYGAVDLPIHFGYLKSRNTSVPTHFTEDSYSTSFGILAHFGVLVQFKKWPHQMRFEIGRG